MTTPGLFGSGVSKNIPKATWWRAITVEASCPPFRKTEANGREAKNPVTRRQTGELTAPGCLGKPSDIAVHPCD
jgi:hypothetical protein